MDFFENISNSFSTIFANKLRSGLTMLGIIIGVSSVIIMIAIGEGAQKSVTSRISEMGSNLLIVTPGSASKTNVRSSGGNTDSLTNEDIKAITEISGISGISPEFSGRKQIIYGNNNTSATVTGVKEDYEVVRNFSAEYGQFVSEKNNEEYDRVAVLGSDVQEELFPEKNPLGEDIRIGNNIFTIVGIMEEKSGASNNVVFIPLSTFQSRVAGSKSISTIYISVTNAEEIDTVLSEVEYTLLQEHQIADAEDMDFTVLNQADVLETLGEITQIFTLLLGGIAGISLLVGGIGVMNIMLVSVTERTREIGIRKAIGAKENDILMQFLTESTLLSVAGGAVGIAISWGIISFADGKIDMELGMTLNSILLAFLFSASVGIFFGGFPAYKAGKLKPIDALRFE